MAKLDQSTPGAFSGLFRAQGLGFRGLGCARVLKRVEDGFQRHIVRIHARRESEHELNAFQSPHT